jgi:hypothetical protein
MSMKLKRFCFEYIKRTEHTSFLMLGLDLRQISPPPTDHYHGKQSFDFLFLKRSQNKVDVVDLKDFVIWRLARRSAPFNAKSRLVPAFLIRSVRLTTVRLGVEA